MAQCESTPAPETFEVVFSEAKDSFLSTLSTEDKAVLAACNDCSSPDSVLKHIGELKPKFTEKRWGRLFSKAKAFADGLAPYLEIIGIVISSNPQWSAIAWGAFRLVLQLASNFGSFFERLTELLDEMKDALPRFKDLLELLKSGESASQRIRFSIQSFYKDLFAFFESVAMVFTRKNGRIKRTPVVIAQLMWQPFDIKFRGILERITSHRDLISEELKILQVQRTTETQQVLQFQLGEIKDKLRKSHEASMRSHSMHSRETIMKFIGPPEFIQEYEAAKSLCQSGSCEWLLRLPEFKLWREKSSRVSTLWVKGKPGCGKSVLAAKVIDEITSVPEDNAHAAPSCLYFFFNSSRQGLTTTDDACRALLAQVFQHYSSDESISYAFDFAMANRKEGQVRGSAGIIWDTLSLALQRYSQTTWLVIDAVDECAFPDITDHQEHPQALSDFIERLHRLVQESGTKLLVLSRPSVWGMNNLVSKYQVPSIRITTDMVRQGLQQYCLSNLQELIRQDLIPRQLPVSLEDLIKTLLVGADGMFLWARLMFSYLRSPVIAPPHLAQIVRLRHIESLRYPESLDRMYCRILNLVSKTNSYQRNLARKVFMWIIFRKSDEFSAIQLHDVLTASFREDDGNSLSLESARSYNCLSNFSSFDESIILSCASLVELYKTRTTWHYHFIHKSATEFFTERFKSSAHGIQQKLEPSVHDFFFQCPAEVEMELAAACANYLRLQIVPRPLSPDTLNTAGKDQPLSFKQLEIERLNLKSRTSQKHPFLEYACAYWTTHLRHVYSNQTCSHSTFWFNLDIVVNSFNNFLNARFSVMTWIEALYLLVAPKLISQQVPDLSYCASASAVANPPAHISERHETFVANLSDLSDDLRRLDHEWGVSLRIAPDQIWKDITAFLNSRFLQKTSAVHISSMAGDAPVHEAQSQQPLSTISSSNISQDCLAKLSVWPSRAFENAWHQFKYEDDIQVLLENCNGWTARYQIWDTTSDLPVLQAEYSVSLEIGEVYSQVQNFLRGARSVPVAETATAKGQSHDLKIPFSTTINRHDLDVFMVLRTVYRLVRQPSSPLDVVEIQHHVIPLDFNDNLRLIWGPNVSSPASNGASTRKRVGYSYDYGFEFNEAGQYLLYHDNAKLSIRPKGQHKMAASLAVFEMLSSTPKSETPVLYLGSIAVSDSNKLLGPWTFHPKLPILAVGSWDFERGSELALWSFCEREGDSFDYVDLGRSRLAYGFLSDLGFSACGENIITQNSSSQYRSIKSIVQHKIYAKQKAATKRPAVPTTQALSPSRAKIGGMTVQAYHAGAIRSGHLQHYLDSNQRSVYQQLAVSTSGQADIGIVQHRDGVDDTHTQPILSLPKTEHINYLDIDMNLPAAKDSNIRLVVNKRPQTCYSMSDPTDTLFPAVITKDRRALSRELVGTKRVPNTVDPEPSSAKRRRIQESQDASD